MIAASKRSLDDTLGLMAGLAYTHVMGSLLMISHSHLLRYVAEDHRGGFLASSPRQWIFDTDLRDYMLSQHGMACTSL